jgi:putative phosphoribosyl transferase
MRVENRTQHHRAWFDVEIPSGRVSLTGDLVVPVLAQGLVIFAHGSGSSRKSPRNVQVARTLNQEGLATLLFDLLTPLEAMDRENVFDVPFLAGRLRAATAWAQRQEETQQLRVGYFGASTGAAAALWAAADPDVPVSAVVSRGGRPDLAHSRLSLVRAPTLLIVGGDDTVVLQLNNLAFQELRCDAQLHVVPGATHLFEEPGTLEAVADVSTTWFKRHLGGATKG